MKRLLPLAMAALLSSTTRNPAAEPTLGGTVSGSLSPGTYRVTNDLIVPAAATWTLSAGTDLRFDAQRGLRVLGRLLAAGTAERPVRFGPDTGAAWNGLVFAGTEMRSNRLERVILEGAETGLTLDPAARLRLVVADSRIRSHRTHGILIAAGAGAYHLPEDIAIERCSITDNGQAGVLITSYAEGCSGSSGSPTLRGNEIAFNGGPGISLVASVDSSRTCFPTPATSLIRAVLDANDLHDNQDGIRAETRSPSGQIFPPPNQPRVEPRIVNNLIRDHRADGIALLTGRSQPQVLNNTLLRNAQAGIYHLAGVSGEGRIRNNLVVGNGRGLVGNATAPPPTNAVAFNNVFGNGQNWVSHPPGYGQTSRTNASGHPVDFADNLSLDPGLGGPDAAHLLPGSPMIDAGSALQAPLRDRDGDGRGSRVDVGCDEFRAPFRIAEPRVFATHLEVLLEGEPGVEYAFLTSGAVNFRFTDAIARRASPLLVLPEVIDSRDFLEAFATTRHLQPALEYLWSRLSAATRQRIDDYYFAFPRPNPEPALEPLLRDLNTILAGPNIYERARFATVELSPATAALAARNPTGTTAQHLNRMLLEDTLAGIITPATAVPDATGQVTVWISRPGAPADPTAFFVATQAP